MLIKEQYLLLRDLSSVFLVVEPSKIIFLI